MNKLKFVSLLLLTVYCAGSVIAQKNENSQKSEVNFSGTWILKETTSDVALVGKSYKVETMTPCFHSLVIQQNSPELKIDKIKQCQNPSDLSKLLISDEIKFVHFIDERGEVNQSARNQEVFSKTKHKKNQIFIKHYKSKNGSAEKSAFYTTDLSLSKDGSSLKEVITSISDNGFSVIATSVLTKIYFLKK